MDAEDQARIDRLIEAMMQAMLPHGLRGKTIDRYRRAIYRVAIHIDRCPYDIKPAESTHISPLCRSSIHGAQLRLTSSACSSCAVMCWSVQWNGSRSFGHRTIVHYLVFDRRK